MSLVDDEVLPPFFVGREVELRWLEDKIGKNRHPSIVQVVGASGIGKTALLHQFFQMLSRKQQVLFLNAGAKELDLDRISYRLRNDSRNDLRIVVVDDAESISTQIDDLYSVVFNRKSIRKLILSTALPLRHKPAIETLHLRPLNDDAALALLEGLARLSYVPNQEAIRAILASTGGHPLAIHLTARLLETHDPSQIARMLEGSLYELRNQILVPQRELINKVEPAIVRANEQILERLRARPQDIHRIGHRKFEELIAELLEDMDFDVELTQATRDGGRDVLAYWNSPVGRLLILVEAKKYRPDRTIGVQLVRTLYGTLVDEQANSAMIVTTSDYSLDARSFEAKHKWQLGLKNYTDLVGWIENYKKPKAQRPNIILP
jgi:restriction system protein